jgi:hypothetical protein
MKELNLSPDFTIDDIHKIREYNMQLREKMTKQEYREYIANLAREGEKRIEFFRNQAKLGA